MATDSHVLAEDPAVDLALAAAMTAELEDYIVKSDLYRTVIARTPRGDEKITMTGGDLLTRLHRLQGERARLTPAQQQEFDDVARRAEATIYSLRTRFHTLLRRELKARVDALRWFLDDCPGDPKRCRANYPYEIRNRQRIEEILKRVDTELDDEEREMLASLDQRLRTLTHGTDFLWDENLASIFPPSPYWYLYVMP